MDLGYIQFSNKPMLSCFKQCTSKWSKPILNCLRVDQSLIVKTSKGNIPMWPPLPSTTWSKLLDVRLLSYSLHNKSLRLFISSVPQVVPTNNHKTPCDVPSSMDPEQMRIHMGANTNWHAYHPRKWTWQWKVSSISRLCSNKLLHFVRGFPMFDYWRTEGVLEIWSLLCPWKLAIRHLEKGAVMLQESLGSPEIIDTPDVWIAATKKLFHSASKASLPSSQPYLSQCDFLRTGRNAAFAAYLLLVFDICGTEPTGSNNLGCVDPAMACWMAPSMGWNQPFENAHNINSTLW